MSRLAVVTTVVAVFCSAAAWAAEEKVDDRLPDRPAMKATKTTAAQPAAAKAETATESKESSSKPPAATLLSPVAPAQTLKTGAAATAVKSDEAGKTSGEPVRPVSRAMADTVPAIPRAADVKTAETGAGGIALPAPSGSGAQAVKESGATKGAKTVGGGTPAAVQATAGAPPSAERDGLRRLFGKPGAISDAALMEETGATVGGGKTEKGASAGGVAESGKGTAARQFSEVKSGVAGAGETAKATSSSGAAVGVAAEGDSGGETAASDWEELRERFHIPDDVPVDSPKDAMDFARDVQILRGKVEPEVWRARRDKGSEAVITDLMIEDYHIPRDAAVGGARTYWVSSKQPRWSAMVG